MGVKREYRTQYRVMYKAPGSSRFVLAQNMTTLKGAKARAKLGRENTHGDWEYRVDQREVVTENGPWKVVPDEE